jgi:hypothetical protein
VQKLRGMADLAAFMQSLAAQQFQAQQRSAAAPAPPTASLAGALGFPEDQGQALAYYAACVMHQHQQQQRLAEQQAAQAQGAPPANALMAALAADPGSTQVMLAALLAKEAAKPERGGAAAPAPVPERSAIGSPVPPPKAADAPAAVKAPQDDSCCSSEKEAVRPAAGCACPGPCCGAHDGRCPGFACGCFWFVAGMGGRDSQARLSALTASPGLYLRGRWRICSVIQPVQQPLTWHTALCRSCTVGIKLACLRWKIA